MKLEPGRQHLRVNCEGKDVAFLQRQLANLDYEISSEEFRNQRFGKYTNQAVKLFLKKDRPQEKVPGNPAIDQDLLDRIEAQASGQVSPSTPHEEATITTPNPSQPQFDDKTFLVEGHVRYVDGTPFTDDVVHAYDKDLRSEQILGKSNIDAEGHYEIKYLSNNFCRAEKDRADLIVGITGNRDKYVIALTEKDVYFNAEPNQTIDITIYAQSEKLSEYERYRDILLPLIEPEDVSFATLTNADINFLAGKTELELGETAIEWKHIKFLHWAADFSQKTKLPPEVFYACFRQGLPTDLPSFLEWNPDEVRHAIEISLDDNLIPDLENLQPSMRLGEILEQLQSFAEIGDFSEQEQLVQLDDVATLTLTQIQDNDRDLYDFLVEKAKAQLTTDIADLDDLLQPGLPLQENPMFFQVLQRAKVYHLADVVGVETPKITSLLQAGATINNLDDATLKSLVTDSKLLEHEARNLGLMANLYHLCDENFALAQTLKQAQLNQTPNGHIENIRDLTTLRPNDWLAILNQSELEPPNQLSKDDYAVLLAKKIEHLYPSDVLLARLLPRTPDEATEVEAELRTHLETLQPLFEQNTAIFGQEAFDHLKLEGIEPDRIESLRTAYSTLKQFANTVPGLALETLLDDCVPERGGRSPQDVTELVSRRVQLLSQFQIQNSEVEFLALDYTPDSEDLQRLNFEDFVAEEQQLVLNTLKAYQRVHSLTQDCDRTQTLLQAGYRSATRIAHLPLSDFLQKTGLAPDVGRAIRATALQVNTASIAAMGTLIETIRDDFGQLAVGNSNAEDIKQYLRKVNGLRDLFGSLDHCHCQHCQSILSPAAYFVDLMYYVEKYILKPNFGTDNTAETLHLQARRPDLWNLPLTCENTNQLIPYLDLINEVLENYIAKEIDSNIDMPMPGEGDRKDIEQRVYQALYRSAHSFRQPFCLPLETLQLYLSHFQQTLGEIATALTTDQTAIARATLNLSQHEYDLIVPTQASIGVNFLQEPDFLRQIYGLSFKVATGATTVEFYDATLYDSTLNSGGTAYLNSKNDVQLLLQAMGLTRKELGQLITTQFVVPKGSDSVHIQAEKRSADSVQNDIERIHGLTFEVLDRMHRFTRLGHKLPWSIPELDTILSSLQSGISADTLPQLVTLLTLQKRFALSLGELCALWHEIPTAAIPQLVAVEPVEGHPLFTQWVDLSAQPLSANLSFFDQSFNLPNFGPLAQPLKPAEISQPRFIHPTFQPSRVEPNLPRLLAGLRVGDETLYQLITRLHRPLHKDLTAVSDQDPKASEYKGFALSVENLSLLYRHARLAELLKLSVPELFQLIALAKINADGYIANLKQLETLLEFYDWWKTTPYSLPDLALITGTSLQDAEGYPDPAAIAQAIIQDTQASGALTFTDTVFAFLEGVTEAQSQEIVAIARSPRYRLAAHLAPTTELVIPAGSFPDRTQPEDIQPLKAALKKHLSTYDKTNAQGHFPIFADTLFAAVEGVTPAQSRALLKANLPLFETLPPAIVPAQGSRYRLAQEFKAEALTISADLTAKVTAIKQHLANYFTPDASTFPSFDETVLTAIDGVTATQSQALIAANSSLFIPVPLENTYWLSQDFLPETMSLTLPQAIPLTEAMAKAAMLAYHPAQIIPKAIASQLNYPVDRLNILLEIVGVNLTDAPFVEELQGEAPPARLTQLIEQLRPLIVLFRDPVFDADALQFIRQHGFESTTLLSVGASSLPELPGLVPPPAFSPTPRIDIETVKLLSIYRRFARPGADGKEDTQKNLHTVLPILLDFVKKPDDAQFSGQVEEIQAAIAQLCEVEPNVVIALLQGNLSLSDNALQALDQLSRYAKLAQSLGISGGTLKGLIPKQYDSLDQEYKALAQASDEVLSAFRAKYPDEKEWQANIEPFENKIRARKRDALTDYLIARYPQFENQRDLYHHFLLDVELEGCARTSRVVAAISSVQLYVHRVFLNLEQDRAGKVYVQFGGRTLRSLPRRRPLRNGNGAKTTGSGKPIEKSSCIPKIGLSPTCVITRRHCLKN
jgi:hypothetical protein